MCTRGRTGVLALAACLVAAGCDSFGPGETLARFEWAELDITAAESSQFGLFGDDVVVLGDLNTSTACFGLSPAYSESGSTATLRVRASVRNRPGCGEEAATYRYEAELRNMDGMTQLRVIHDVEGEEPREFTHDLTLST